MVARGPWHHSRAFAPAARGHLDLPGFTIFLPDPQSLSRALVPTHQHLPIAVGPPLLDDDTRRQPTDVSAVAGDGAFVAQVLATVVGRPYRAEMAACGEHVETLGEPEGDQRGLAARILRNHPIDMQRSVRTLVKQLHGGQPELWAAWGRCHIRW